MDGAAWAVPQVGPGLLLALFLTAAALLLAAALTRRLLWGFSSYPDVAIEQTGDRGKILVAERAFARGSVVLREDALLSVPSGALPLAAFARLRTPARQQLASLHCPPSLSPARPEDGGRALSEAVGEHGEALAAAMLQSGWSAKAAGAQKDEVWRMLRAWDANKLSFQGAKGPEQCVFPTISRMNHSCEPNVRLIPGRRGSELLALAAVDIAKGEELCICYPERNAMPLLHFLHLPTAGRRHLLLRWGFECACPRCAKDEDEARTFRCCGGDGSSGCSGQHSARGAAGLGPCGSCGRAPPQGRIAALLEAEDGLWREASQQLAPLLRKAETPATFPLAEVMDLLGRCGDAGLSQGHWLVFWLLCLCGVGGSGRDLRVAALGAARALALPVLPGTLPELAARAPPSARQLLAGADLAVLRGVARRPGATPRLAAYFALG